VGRRVLRSRRANDGGFCGAVSSSTPMPARIARTVSASRYWFFGENGSIDGGVIAAFSPAIHGGTYSRRVKTNRAAGARYGRRKLHAARVASFSQSTPI